MRRPNVISVRPRKGSTLEAIQKATNNEMASVIHKWADEDKGWSESFTSMKKQSEEDDK